MTKFESPARYGEYCGRRVSTRYEESGAFHYVGTDYAQLGRTFDERDGVVVDASDVLVDIPLRQGTRH